MALVLGDPAAEDAPLVRVHSECLTGDVFASLRCDCGEQPEAAMAAIAEAGSGVVVYLRGHEGRGIGIVDKLRAYALQDAGCDTVDADLRLGLPIDARDYAPAAALLRRLGVRRVTLLSNNPDKSAALVAHGVTVAAQRPLRTAVRAENHRYLATKRSRLGHHLRVPEDGVHLLPTRPPAASITTEGIRAC